MKHPIGEHLYVLFLFLFPFVIEPIGVSEPAEEVVQSRSANFCHTDQIHEEWLKSPLNKKKHESLSQQYTAAIKNKNGFAHRSPALILPLVVHVIHDNGPENIPTDQILLGIEQLNLAFANSGEYFSSQGINTDFQFCMAKQDEFGNDTDGITRDRNSLTDVNSSTQNEQLKDINRWDPLSYINIWVVNEICDNTDCDVAGYAHLPGSHGSTVDGIVVEAEYFGSSIHNSKVLVHEMGHYLGLYHTFQGGCSNYDCLLTGDKVCDTPPDNSTAPNACDQVVNSCTTDEEDTSTNNPFRAVALGGLGDQPDQFKNYMDYSRFECYDRFTAGQTDRMRFFIDNVRSSLLQSQGCNEPCENPIIALFSASSTTVVAGSIVQFQNNSQNSEEYIWLNNGDVFSVESNPALLFDDPGNFMIVLQASSSDPNCLTQSDTLWIEVNCASEANFTPQPSECLTLNTTLLFTSQATNATSINWYLNGVLLGSGSTQSVLFDQIGLQTLSLLAINAGCADTFTVNIKVGCAEICDNGIDDNFDGLVDCFDPICACELACQEFYYQDCGTPCPTTNDFDFTGEMVWSAALGDGVAMQVPKVGDLNGDGISEIVLTRETQEYGVLGEVVILNSQTGSIISTFGIPFRHSYDPNTPILAIADLDNDGDGEIVVSSESSNLLNCYDMNGGLIWSGMRNSESRFIGIADFDYDGFAEVYSAGDIFNGQTGELLASTAFSFETSSIAADILADSYCGSCQGLELVTTRGIFSYNGTDLIEVVSLNTPTQYEASMSIIDWDLDGDLDLALRYIEGSVSEIMTIEIMDIQTPLMIAMTSFDRDWSLGWPGAHAIGDTDGDGQLNMAIALRFDMVILDNNLDIMTTTPIFEPGGNVGMTLFDFDDDGAAEIVTRGGSSVFIINGSNGDVEYERSCESGTTFEYPVIASTETGGEVHIFLPCETCVLPPAGPPECNINMIAISSLNGNWAKSRPIWNQDYYFNTHINDNLQVPKQQQANHLVTGMNPVGKLNNFMQQYGFEDLLLPDVEVVTSSANCNAETQKIDLEMELCNIGSAVLMELTPITVYKLNPTTSSLAEPVIQLTLEQAIEPDECITVLFELDGIEGNTNYVFIVNDDGSQMAVFDLELDFPSTSVLECDYTNNLDSFNVDIPLISVDLGPDQLICNFSTFTLRTDNVYENYLWSDGSIDSVLTVYRPGIYWVHVSGSCGQTATDTITIQESPSSMIYLGTDTSICAGQSIQLGQSSYDPMFTTFSWSPADGLVCDSCPQILVTPDTTTTYTLLTMAENGCLGYDEVVVTVVSFRDTIFDFDRCVGDTLIIFDFVITETGVYYDTISGSNGCDTLLGVRVEFVNILRTFDLIEICSNDSALIFDQFENEPNTYVKTFASDFGCDSVHSIVLNVLEPIFNYDTLSICQGDSILIFNQYYSVPITVEESYLSVLGCDSNSVISLEVFNESIQFISFPPCDENGLGYIEIISPIGTSWSYSSNGIDFNNNPTIQNLDVGIHQIFAQSDICQIETSVEILDAIPFQVQFLQDTIIIDEFDATQLIPSITEGGPINVSYNWTPTFGLSCLMCPAPFAMPTGSEIYTVIATNEFGCESSDSVLVFVRPMIEVFAPNVFSPNQDDVNDFFTLYTGDDVVEVISLHIYNRWGGKVFENYGFEPNIFDLGWDGTFNDKPQAEGVYVYVFEYLTNKGQRHTIKGSLNLIR